MTTPELPPLSVEGEIIADDGRYIPIYNGDDVEERERILLARIAELEADAERYRWLRKRNELTGDVDPRGPYCIEDDDGESHYPTGAQLDAAIDAAREGK